MNDAPKTSGLAIAALVCGVAFCVPLAPLAAIILGIVALSNIGNSHGRVTGRGLAIAGICLGAFGIIANIGIMVALAVPNFVKYQTRAKQSEARTKLMAIGTGAAAYHAERQRFPESSKDWVPASCTGGEKCAVDPQEWNSAPWNELGFSPDMAGYFQVRFINAGNTFSAEARGDLDGDGEPSIFRISGAVNTAGDVELDPVVDTTPDES